MLSIKNKKVVFPMNTIYSLTIIQTFCEKIAVRKHTLRLLNGTRVNILRLSQQDETHLLLLVLLSL